MAKKKPTINSRSIARSVAKREATTNASSHSDAHKAWAERELVDNVLLSRGDLLRKFLDPRRDFDDECGYPKPNELTAQHFKAMYDRNPIAARVVQVFPLESWQTQPTVYEDKDNENETEFEKAWDTVCKSLAGESLYQDEAGNPVWEHLQRADVLSGIGHFGILLIGTDDGKRLEEPADGVDTHAMIKAAKKAQKTGIHYGKGKYVNNLDAVDPQAQAPKTSRKLTFLRCFDESLVQITQYESDKHNPRFGLPKMYSVTLNDPADQHSGVGLPLATLNVHWTRVIHIADQLGSSEIFAVPRQRPVYNNLHDCVKLYGGSAEMYWRGAFPGLSIETHPQLGGDVKIDGDAMREQMYNYMNTLQRYLALQGMSAKTLAPTVVDPTPQIEVQLTAICILLGIPKRIFMGSERGELSSGQDADTWRDRLTARRTKYITPKIIVPFVDRLIAMKILPKPKGFSVDWPGADSLAPADQASIAVTVTDALSKYIAGGVDTLITPLDYLVNVIGIAEEMAKAMLKATMEGIVEEDTGTSPLLGLVGGITGMLELFQKHKDGALSEESLKQLIMLFYGVDDAKADMIYADGLPEPPAPPPGTIPKGFAPDPTLQPPKGAPTAKKPPPFVKNTTLNGGPGSGPQESATAFGAALPSRYDEAPSPTVTAKDVKNVKAALKAKGRLNEDGTVSLFHDTVDDDKAIESIMKHGLVPGAAKAPGQAWEAEHSSVATYFHQHEQAAQGIGVDKVEGMVTIEARIPVNEHTLSRIISDEENDGSVAINGPRDLRTGNGALAVVGGVPAEYLRIRRDK